MKYIRLTQGESFREIDTLSRDTPFFIRIVFAPSSRGVYPKRKEFAPTNAFILE